MEQNVEATRRTLFGRLSVILFFAELAHGMLLYGIIPELTSNRFSQGAHLLLVLPVTAVQLAGFCLAAYTLAELVLKLTAGHQVDHRGPDGPLLVGLVVSLLSVPVILLAPTPNLMLLGAILHGVGSAPIWPAVISAWTRGRSARERGEIMGQILTWWMAGLGVGLILGNILVGLTGRVELVATYAPILMWSVAIGAALWTGRRLGVPAHHGMDADEISNLARNFPPELKMMALGLFIQNLAFGSLILTFREGAKDLLHLNPAQFGLVVLIGGAPAVGLLGPMGKISDRVGRRKSVIYSMLVVAPLITAAPFLGYMPLHPWARFALLIPGILVAGVAYAFLLPAWHALALGRIPQHQRGRSLAILMSVEMAALAGGHLVGPSLYARVHPTAPFLVAGITFGILALIYSRGYILPEEAEDQDDEPRGTNVVPPTPQSPGPNGTGPRPREKSGSPQPSHTAE
ncbi:MAG: MFS transporter [Armatimonadota bacterium]